MEEEHSCENPREYNNEVTIYDSNLLDSFQHILISAVQEDVGEH